MTPLSLGQASDESSAPIGARSEALGLIADLQPGIHRCLKQLIGDKPISLLDFPDIRDVGDSAISLGDHLSHAILHNSYGKIGILMSPFGTGIELVYSARSLNDAAEWARARAASVIEERRA